MVYITYILLLLTILTIIHIQIPSIYNIHLPINIYIITVNNIIPSIIIPYTNTPNPNYLNIYFKHIILIIIIIPTMYTKLIL